MSKEEKIRVCPKCTKVLTKAILPHKRNIYQCEDHGYFRLTVPRSKAMCDSKNWKATCIQCKGTMDYYNFKYCCRKCGHILEV